MSQLNLKCQKLSVFIVDGPLAIVFGQAWCLT